MNNFRVEFFRLYDRKIASGELKFSELGMSKDDFTRLCTDTEFTLTEEKIKDLCIKMKLTQEETEKLWESCK
ncbi:MAG: hypothetical protein AB9836_10415 [Aminipila sp.]